MMRPELTANTVAQSYALLNILVIIYEYYYTRTGKESSYILGEERVAF
jgi:hypothetical protein